MSRAALAMLLCCAGGLAVGAQQPADRSRPPALAPAPELRLPPIQKTKLSNGLAVWLVESNEVPLVQVNLLVNAAAQDDPPGRFGLASLTAAMLDEGTATRSALDIADEIDFLGASLGTGASYDASAVRLNTPVARIEAALSIMADVAIRPTFPAAELERLRQERLTALLQARDDPAAVAPVAFARVVYGTRHRYGVGVAGAEATLKAFTAADLQTFHAATYQPANATMIVVGDVRLNRMQPLLEKHFGAWKGSQPPSPRQTVPAAPAPADRTIYIVDVPGAEQSQIRVGTVGVSRATPDYFALQVLNTILGGSFTSRLNQNLREEHGYSYGASSRFDMRLGAGPFFAAAGVQTDKTSEAVREFFNELNGIVKPVSQDELAKAKNYVALGFPAEFETNDDVAGHLEELIVYQLPENYFERYIANIAAVDAATLQQAAVAHIQPDRLAVVVVGDRKVIEPGIRALKLGTVAVLSVDQVFGP